jgi:GntR family transcriptional regulator, rspAB operon transcriptional repressor
VKVHREFDGLAGEAYLLVRERILRGELAIGQTISRRKLAAELGMSFLPVSEAFRRLEHEGLVESRPRAGTRVRLPTEEDVRGQYTVREALEVKSAMLFAEFATPSERTELLRLAARVDMLRATDSNRLLYLSVHERLHWRIAECTRCPALREALRRTSALASTWLCAAGLAPPDSLRHKHQDLLKVIVSGDVGEAAEAMRHHIQSSLANTLARLEPYFQMREKYADTFSRTPSKQLPLQSPAAGTALVGRG